MPTGTTCLWRCMLPDSPEWEKVRRNRDTLQIDLSAGAASLARSPSPKKTTWCGPHGPERTRTRTSSPPPKQDDAAPLAPGGEPDSFPTARVPGGIASSGGLPGDFGNESATASLPAWARSAQPVQSPAVAVASNSTAPAAAAPNTPATVGVKRPFGVKHLAAAACVALALVSAVVIAALKSREPASAPPPVPPTAEQILAGLIPQPKVPLSVATNTEIELGLPDGASLPKNAQFAWEQLSKPIPGDSNGSKVNGGHWKWKVPPKAGGETVTYRLTMTLGEETAHREFEIKVKNDPPVAKFKAGKKSVKIGDDLELDASESSDLNGDPLTYEWQVNDKKVSNPTGAKFTYHVPDNAGKEIKVALVVYDNKGEKSEKKGMVIGVVPREASAGTNAPPVPQQSPAPAADKQPFALEQSGQPIEVGLAGPPQGPPRMSAWAAVWREVGRIQGHEDAKGTAAPVPVGTFTPGKGFNEKEFGFTGSVTNNDRVIFSPAVRCSTCASETG